MAFENIFKKKTGYDSFSENMRKNMARMIADSSDYAEEDRKKNQLNPVFGDRNHLQIRICPEPIRFLKEITKESNTNAKKEAFEKILENFKEYSITKPEGDYWLNKTSKGINLRLGNVDNDRGNQEPATLGDDCVHGVVVGRTGSGKSVLINNIILNLMTEYSPWELDLYLVDMKKVELSRYMENAEDGSYLSPHVSACGATSEIGYVVSMIQYICDCMKARQNFFAAIGIQKIEDFREKYSKNKEYELVLPRILLLIDEFQQLFLEATGKNKRILNDCITAITKLGRATGVHLLFASQEMSNALEGNQLANFKLRIALPCDEGVSSKILGNTAASKITEKGITLVNRKGGSAAEDNMEYRTPFIDDKDKEDGSPSEFRKALMEIHKLSEQSGIMKVQSFYQEDAQENMEKIERIKKKDSIKQQTSVLMEKKPTLYENFILGNGVLYTNKKNDYQYLFLEEGKKRNVGILCSSDYDQVNMLKMMADNFKFGNSEKNGYRHYVYFDNEAVRSAYPDFMTDLGREYKEIDTVQELCQKSSQRMRLNMVLEKVDYSLDAWGIVCDYCTRLLESVDLKDVSNEDLKYFKKDTYVQDWKELSKKDGWKKEATEIESANGEKLFVKGLSNSLGRQILNVGKLEAAKASKQKDAEKVKNITDFLKFVARLLSSNREYADKVLYLSMKNKKYTGNKNVNWVIGTDNLDKDEYKILSNIMAQSTLHNELYIFVSSDYEATEACYKACNYLFLNMPEERAYTKYKMEYTKKSDDCKSIDVRVVNENRLFSFKKFYYEGGAVSTPELVFEEDEY